MDTAGGGPRALLANLEASALAVPPEVEEDLGGGHMYIRTPIEVLEHERPREMKARLGAIRDFRDEFLESPMFSLDPPYNLRNWARVLESVGCDADVAGRLANLAATDPMAHAEATRILAHLLKPGGSFKGARPSGWVNSVIMECEEYLRNWEEWESRCPWDGTSRARPQWRRGPSEWAPPAPPPGPPPADEAPWAPPHRRGPSEGGAAGSSQDPREGGSSGSRDAPGARFRTPGLESPWGAWANYRPSGSS